MLRRSIAILVCSFYLLGSCVSFIPPIYYQLNKEYVASHLCVNKDKPEMHCNGKCFVGKEIIKLNEQQHTEKKDQESQQQHEIFPHVMIYTTTLCFYNESVLLTQLTCFHPVLSAHVFTAELPPEFLS